MASTRSQRWLATTCLTAVMAIAAGSQALAQQRAPAPSDYPKWGAHADILGLTAQEHSSAGVEFFMPMLQSQDSMIFIDAALNGDFNDEVYGTFGVGYRKIISPDLILGGIVAVDTTRDEKTFSAVSLGVEAIGTAAEARVNVQLPFTGARGLSDTTDVVGVPGTLTLLEHSLVQQSFKRRVTVDQVPLTGVEGEVGVNLPIGFDRFDDELKVFAGGYHYQGDGVGSYTGVSGRLEYKLHDVLGDRLAGADLTLSGGLTYDKRNDTNFAGEIRFTIPLGATASRREDEMPLSAIEKRMTRRVVRSTRIRTERRTRTSDAASTTSLTVDPVTGLRLNAIYFADGANTLGAGTLADPTTLDDAVAKANTHGIVVAEGARGAIATGGVRLGGGERLVGGGVSIPVRLADGSVTTFQLGFTAPVIVGVPTANVITLSQNNSLRSLSIQGGLSGIGGSNVGDLTLSSVSLSGSAGAGISVVNTSGSNTIAVSDISVAGAGGAGIAIGDTGGGTTTVTGFFNVAVASAGGGGVLFDGVAFDADPARLGFQRVQAGTLTIGDPAIPGDVNGDGLRLNQVSGDLAFNSLTIGTSAGTGLYIRDNQVSTFALGNTGGAIVTAGGAAIDIDPVALAARFDVVSSTGANDQGSGGDAGILLADIVARDPGTVALQIGDVSISGAGGNGLTVSGNSADLAFGATMITNVGGVGIALAGNTGAVSFGAASVTSSGGDSIALTGNAGSVAFGTTAIAAPGVNAIDIEGTTGPVTFGDVVVTGLRANGVGLDLNGAELTGSVLLSSLDLTGADGTPPTGSIGIDLRGVRGGQAVHVGVSPAANPAIDTPSAIRNVAAGVYLNASSNAAFAFGDGENAVDQASRLLAATPVNAASAPTAGSYNFLDVDFLGASPGTGFSAAVPYFFTQNGAGSGTSPTDAGSVAGAEASSATVLIPVGATAINVTTDGGGTLDIDNGQSLTAFATPGGTIDLRYQAPSTILIAAVSAHAIDTTGNGSPTLGNASAQPVVNLGGGNVITNVRVSGAGGDGIRAANIHNVTLDNVSIATTVGAGLAFDAVSGTVTAQNGLGITGSSGAGLNVTNSSAAFSFGNVIIGNTGTAGGGVVLTSNTGSLNFGNGLSIATSSGTGFAASGGGTISVAAAGTRQIGTTTGRIVAWNSVSVGTGGASFASLTATGTVAADAVSLANVGGAGNAFNGGTVSIAGTSEAGSDGISVTGTAANVGFGPAAITNTAANGILVSGNRGTVAFSGAMTVTGAAGDGVNLSGNAGNVGFAGTTTIANAAGNGVAVSGNSGTTNFAAVNLNASQAAGLAIAGNTGTVTVSRGSIGQTATNQGAVSVIGGNGDVTISAGTANASGTGLAVTGRNAGTVTFAGTHQQSGTGTGVVLANTGGTVAFTNLLTLNGTGGGIVATGTGGTTRFAAVNATQTGASAGLAIASASGSAAYLFNGQATVDTTAGIGTGVSVTGAGTANVSFLGGLSIATSSGTGFAASGGGTISVAATGTRQIATATGQIVSWNGVSVGTGGASFASLSSTGTVAADAVSLANVGAAGNTFNGGAVSIAGTSGAGSDGIAVTGAAANVGFGPAAIANTAANGILVSGNSGTVGFAGATTVTGAAGDGVNLSGNAGNIGFAGTITIANTVGNGITLANDTGAVSFAATSIQTPGLSGIRVQGTAATIGFGDVDVTGLAANGVGLNLNATTLSGAFNAHSVDVAGAGGTPPTGSIGIDLRGVQGGQMIALGTSSASNPATDTPSIVQNVATGLFLDATSNANFIIGDGESAVDRASRLVATTSVNAASAPTLGSYNLLDVDFLGALPGLGFGSAVPYFFTGGGTSPTDPGSVAGAEASAATILVPVGAAAINVSTNGGATLDLDAGQSLSAFAAPGASLGMIYSAPPTVLISAVDRTIIDTSGNGSPSLFNTGAASVVALGSGNQLTNIVVASSGGTGISAANVSNFVLNNTSIAATTGAGLSLNTVGGSLVTQGGLMLTGTGGAGIGISNSFIAAMFGGQVTINNSATGGSGLLLANNVGGVNFGGGLAISTSTGTGVAASGGGTLTVTDTGTRQISTTTGQALSLDGLAIGVGGLNFTSVTANGAATGVSLNDVASAGGAIALGTVNLAGATTAGIRVSGALAAPLFFTDLDIALNGAGTAFDLNGAALSTDVTADDFDVTNAGVRSGTIGVDLRGLTGPLPAGQIVRLGDAAAGGQSSSIAGVGTGVFVDSASRAQFAYGDGEAAVDQGSTIDATVRIDATSAPTAGVFNFRDLPLDASPGSGFGIGRVYFVDSDGNATGGGDGSGRYGANPATLAFAEANAVAGDVIVLVNDGQVITSAGTNADNTLLLQTNEQVRGYGTGPIGLALAVPSAFQLSGNTVTLADPTAGGAATLTSAAAANVVTLGASGNLIDGFILDGNPAGAARGVKDNGGGAAFTTISHMTIRNFAVRGVEITPSTNTTISGSIFAANGSDVLVNAANTTISNVSSTGATGADSAGAAFQIANATGTTTLTNLSISGAAVGGLAFTNAGGTVNASNVALAGGNPLSITGGGAASFNFDATSSVNAGSGSAVTITGRAGGSFTHAGTITADGGGTSGIVVGGATGANTVSFTGGVDMGAASAVLSGVAVDNNGTSSIVFFANLDVVSAGGAALAASGGGTINVANGTLSTAERVVVLNGVMAGITLASTSSTAGTNNVSLTNVAGTVGLGSGALSGASGTSFLVSDGSAAISYGGTIDQNHAASAVDISRLSGSVTFSGRITASTGTATAVNLSDNTGSAIAFNGGLDLTTSSGFGLSAVDGGTVAVAATAGAETISTATGPILILNDVAIGPGGVNFDSLTTNGAVFLGAIEFVGVGSSGGNFYAGTVSIANPGPPGIQIRGSNAIIGFGDVTIANPDVAGVKIGGANGPISFANLQIALQNANSTGVDLSGAVVNANVTATGFNLTSSSPTGTVGVNLAGTTGPGTIRLGDTDVSGLSSTIAGTAGNAQGPAVGVQVSSTTNANFIFGDGESTTDVGSTITAVTPISATDSLPTNGTYNFLDATLTGDTSNLSSSITTYYVDNYDDGTNDGSSANPGTIAGAITSSAQVIVLVNNQTVGQDTIDIASPFQGSGTTLSLANGRSLVSFFNGPVDLTTLGYAAGGAPANFLLTGVATGGTTITDPTDAGAPNLTTTSAAPTVTLAGVNGISGVRIINGSTGAGISGTNISGLTLLNSFIQGSMNSSGVAVTSNTTTTLALSNLLLVGSRGSPALAIDGTSGTTTITRFDGMFAIGGGRGGIAVTNATFDSDPSTVALNPVSGGNSFIGTTGSRLHGNGLALTGVSGTLNYGNLNVANDGGTGVLVDIKTAGTTFTLGSTGGSVDTTNGTAMNLDPLTVAMTLGSVTSTGGTNGIVFDGVAGTFNVTGATTIARTSGYGITAVNTNTGTFGFNTVTVNNGATAAGGVNVASGTLTFAGNTNLTTAGGIGINQSGGALNQTGGTLAVNTGAGTGINQTGGSLTATSAANTLNSTGGAAAILNGGTANLAFFSTSSGGGTNNVSLTSVAGSLNFGTGTLTGSTGTAFLVSGGTADVSYGGSVTSGTGQAVEVANRTSGAVTLSGTISHKVAGIRGISVHDNSGGTVDFSGLTKSITTDNATAVHLTNNTGATVNFSNGGLAITTTTGTGLFSDGTGTLTIAGGSDSITTATSTALSVTGGAGGITSDAALTTTATGRVASIQNRTGGAVTLSGNISTTGTGASAGTGILIQNNTGGSTNFSGATKTISTEGNTALTVANSTAHTVSFSGTTDIDTTTANAVVVTNGGSLAFSGMPTINATYGTGFLANGTGTFAVSGNAQVASTIGAAVNLSGVSTGVTFASVSKTAAGGGFGVILSGVTGAAVDLGGGSLLGGSPAAFLVGNGFGSPNSGGTAAISYQGSITSSMAAAVQIQDRQAGAGDITLSGTISHNSSNNTGILVNRNAGGTITFSGASKSVSTGVVPAVNLANNIGATINFSGGGLTINSGAATGFNATGVGTGMVNVTGGGNTINSTTGTALNVASTTIGASGLTFQSISAGTGATGPINAIVLVDTGTFGGLTVTGTGTGNTGGTIQHTTGSGILLTNTRNVSLSRMNISATGLHGIEGTSVTNLDLTGVSIANPGNAADEHGIFIQKLLGTAAAGTDSVFSGITITGAADNGIVINNTIATSPGSTVAANQDSLTIRNGSTISGSATGGIEAVTSGTGNFRLFVDGSAGANSVTNNRAVGIALNANGGVLRGTVTGGNQASGNRNQITGGFQGVSGGATGTGQLLFDITDNTITPVSGAGSGSAGVAFAAFDSATMRGTISGNSIAPPTLVDGILGISFINEGAGQNIVTISKNIITTPDPTNETGSRGIDIISRGNGGGRIDASVIGNTITDANNNILTFGINVQSGNATRTGNAVCLNINGNAVNATGGPTNSFPGIVLQQFTGNAFQLQGFGGVGTNEAPVEAYVAGQNPGSVNGVDAANVGGRVINYAGGTCATP